jgi:hypothetical protein
MHKSSLNILCAAKTHCPTCRNREAGRTWRESLATAFKLPAGAPDFECPHGLPWGFFAPEQVPPDFDSEMERLRARQGGCCGPVTLDVTPL